MKDLAKRAAELFGKQGKCMRFHRLHNCSNMTKCRRSQCKHRQDNTVIPESCPYPDPIDITDLGKALECFRGLAKTTVSFGMKIQKIYYQYHHKQAPLDIIYRWVLYDATAEQIWEICILAKESEK